MGDAGVRRTGDAVLNRRGYAPRPLPRLRSSTIRNARPGWSNTGKNGCNAIIVQRAAASNLSVLRSRRPFCCLRSGVERLAEEAREKFPDARFEIMSSDTVHKPADAQALVRRMRDIDVLIGTQIMAKGFHFSLLSWSV